MTRSSSMTSCPVLRCLAPRLPVLSIGFGSVFGPMPLGRIVGRPVTPLSLAISARNSATTCFSAAFSASRRSVRASRSPRDSSERGIFSGTDMPGTNRVRYEQVQPRSSSYLPGFLPQVPAGSNGGNGAASRHAAEDAVRLDVVPAGAPNLDIEAVLLGCRAVQRRSGKLVVVIREKDGPDVAHDLHRIVRF